MGLRELLKSIFQPKAKGPGRVEPEQAQETAPFPAIHTFAEIELDHDAEEQGFRIPPPQRAEPAPEPLAELRSLWAQTAQLTVKPPERRVPVPTSADRWKAMKQSIPSPHTFLYQARASEAKRHTAVPPVPLQAYWTTYDNLNRQQKQWYFYWRDRFRQGDTLPTDLSYVFLHTYETLHGVGFESPTQAFLHLRRLHQSYREQHPRLDLYLVDWLDDFIAYYGVDEQEAGRWQQESGQWATGDRQLQYWIDHAQQDQIPGDLFRRLVSYRPDQNKFYRDTPEKSQLDAAFTRAVILTDQFYREQGGKSVFEVLRPSQKRAVHRQAFQGAVFEGETCHYVREGSPPYLEDGRLGELLTQVVRHAENLARRGAGFKTMLRGVDLPEGLASYLTTHLFPKVPVVREVQIDPQKLAHLQRESAAIRGRLAEDMPVTQEQVKLPAQAAPMPTQVATGSRFNLPTDLAVGQLTDVEAVADILDLTPPPGLSLLQQLRIAGFELPQAQLKLSPEVFVSALVDAINEASQVRLGDILIATEGEHLVVVEDYRDELDFLLGLAQTSPEARSTSTLSEPWAAFALALSPVHLAVLERLLSTPTTLAELDAFALTQGTMGSALLEEINEKAQDSLGDILIDPYLNPIEVEETYRFELLRLIQLQTKSEVI